MRILQLIDTLHPGGAERVAVNYANSLADNGIKSYLVSTREKGEFVELLNDEVDYKFLNRKSTFDIIAVRNLIQILKKEKIDIVQAHGTSWFIGVLCKVIKRDFHLVWHNHSGSSFKMPYLKKNTIKFLSSYFSGIISVNENLKNWAITNLRCYNNIYLPNIVISNYNKNDFKRDKFRIACISNLRKEKNHSLLLNAIDKIDEKSKIEIHFIGRDFRDAYSGQMRREFEKRDNVKFHDSIPGPEKILSQMDLGVLVSRYEGMPMAIMEYAAAGLPTIATDVGNCKEMIGKYGILIPSDDVESLFKAIENYRHDIQKAINDSSKLKEHVMSRFSTAAIIPKYLNFCNEICLKT